MLELQQEKRKTSRFEHFSYAWKLRSMYFTILILVVIKTSRKIVFARLNFTEFFTSIIWYGAHLIEPTYKCQQIFFAWYIVEVDAASAVVMWLKITKRSSLAFKPIIDRSSSDD